MIEPDAEILFADDVLDAIQVARWRGLEDETLIRLLGEIAAELREGGFNIGVNNAGAAARAQRARNSAASSGNSTSHRSTNAADSRRGQSATSSGTMTRAGRSAVPHDQRVEPIAAAPFVARRGAAERLMWTVIACSAGPAP